MGFEFVCISLYDMEEYGVVVFCIESKVYKPFAINELEVYLWYSYMDDRR